MKYFIQTTWKRLYLLLLLLFSLSATLNGCGSADPIGLPGPVSKLISIGTPDNSGTSLITGMPGAVQPNALVIATNADLFQAKSLLKSIGDILIPSAMAQVAPTQTSITADENGAFQLSIRANIGNRIEITQTVDGVESEATTFTVTNQVLNLGLTPRNLAILETANTVWISGGENEEGAIFALSLDPAIQQLSFPSPSFIFPNGPGIGPIAVDSVANRAMTTSFSEELLINFDLFGNNPTFEDLIIGPLNIDILSEKNLAMIGLDSTIGIPPSSEALRFYNTVTNEALCSITIPNLISEGALLQTPLVDFSDVTGETFTQVIAVSQFEDAWAISQIKLQECSTVMNISQVPLPAQIVPAGLASIRRGDRAMVSDQTNNIVYDVDFLAGSLTTIQVGNNPVGIAVNNIENNAYIVNSGDNSVTEINLSNLSVKTLEEVGLIPTQIELLPNLNQAVILSTVDQSVVIVNFDDFESN